MQTNCIFCGEYVSLDEQMQSNFQGSKNCDKCEKELKIKVVDRNVEIKNKQVDELKGELKLTLSLATKPFLVWALQKEKLSYSNLGHAYLEINRVLFDQLDKHTNYRDLKKGYEDLLKLIKRTQERGTNPTDDEKNNQTLREESKNTVWNNKNNLFSSLDFYLTVMQNKKTNKYARWGIIIVILFSITGWFLPVK